MHLKATEGEGERETWAIGPDAATEPSEMVAFIFPGYPALAKWVVKPSLRTL